MKYKMGLLHILRTAGKIDKKLRAFKRGKEKTLVIEANDTVPNRFKHCITFEKVGDAINVKFQSFMLYEEEYKSIAFALFMLVSIHMDVKPNVLRDNGSAYSFNDWLPFPTTVEFKREYQKHIEGEK